MGIAMNIKGGAMPRSTNVREESRPAMSPPNSAEFSLTNADISELLATEADTASQPLQRAFRRASRKAFLWTDEASQLYQERRSLTELPGIGPTWRKSFVDGSNIPH